MNIRTYRLYSTAELAAISHSAKKGLERWLEMWVDNSEDLDSEVSVSTEISEIENKRCILFSDDNHITKCIASLSEDSLYDLSELVTHKKNFISRLNHSTDSIASKVIFTTINDLVDSVCEINSLKKAAISIGNSEIAIPSEWHAPGSGCITLSITFGGIEITLSVGNPSEYFLSLEQERNIELSNSQECAVDLTPRIEAIKTDSIRLPFYVGSIDMTVGSLRKLQLGDVIRLDMKLDEPVVFSIGDSDYCCEGFFAKQENSLALELKSINSKLTLNAGNGNDYQKY